MSVGEVNLHNNHSLESNQWLPWCPVSASGCRLTILFVPLSLVTFGHLWVTFGALLGRFWGAVWVTSGSVALNGEEFFFVVYLG